MNQETSSQKNDPLLTKERIARGSWQIHDLDHEGISAEVVLGRARNVEGRVIPENKWVQVQAALLKDMRAIMPLGGMEGYSYQRDGEFCMVGLAKPQEQNESLGELCRDAPFTTILHPGHDEVPRKQEERKEYFHKRMSEVKMCLFLVGGLLENRLAMEGVGIEVMKSIAKQEGVDVREVALFVVDHSGAEQSYRDGADLRKIGPELEQDVMRASFESILEMSGLTKEQVVGMMGHSKGGFFVEKEINTGKYPNASVVEWAMVVMGTKLSKKRKKWAKWTRQYEIKDEALVKVQSGPVAKLIQIALKAPEISLFGKNIRQSLIDLIGPIIAEKYTGKVAAYGREAIMAIVHELKVNKRAILAQQRSLANMSMIVESFEATSSNPRLIATAMHDDTLAHSPQRAYKYAREEYDRSQGVSTAEAMAASSKGLEDSEHNPNWTTIHASGEWMAEQIARLKRRELNIVTQPRAMDEVVGNSIRESRVLLNERREKN